MLSKNQTPSKGILEIPSTLDQEFMQRILPVVQSSHPQSLELYRAPSSSNSAIDLTENNEQTYQFPRKRKFPDTTENFINKSSEPRLKLSEAIQESSMRTSNKESNFLPRDSADPAQNEERKIESQETQVTLEEIQKMFIMQMKNLYRSIEELKVKFEVIPKNSNESPIGLISLVEAYFKSLKDSMELRMKEMNSKTEEMQGLKEIICEEKKHLKELKLKVSASIKKTRFKHYKHKFFRTYNFVEFSDILNDYLTRIPKWHQENLLKSLEVAELYEKSHPIWLEYLRKNFANGKNWYIDCTDWIWLPFEGSIKEKIKYYVLFWEFVECETLNHVRNEIGFDQILVLGGGSFPYRITYLKYKLPAIPLWWNELIDELSEEGLILIQKSKDLFEESNRIIQICRRRIEVA